MFYVNENLSDFLPFEYWQTAAAAAAAAVAVAAAAVGCALPEE